MTTDAADAGGRRGEAGGRAIQIAGLKDLGFLALLILSPGKEWSGWGEQAASATLPPPTFRTFIIVSQGWSACL